MPRKIVDFSARSEILREEPFYVHFSASAQYLSTLSF